MNGVEWLYSDEAEIPRTASPFLTRFALGLIAAGIDDRFKDVIVNVTTSRRGDKSEIFRASTLCSEAIVSVLPVALDNVGCHTQAYRLRKVLPYDFDGMCDVIEEAGKRYCEQIEYEFSFRDVLDLTLVREIAVVDPDHVIISSMTMAWILAQCGGGVLPKVFDRAALSKRNAADLDPHLWSMGYMLSTMVIGVGGYDMLEVVEAFSHRVLSTSAIDKDPIGAA